MVDNAIGSAVTTAPDTKSALQEKAKVRRYQSEVDAGDRVYETWENDFQCKDLEGYYTGLAQWDDAEKGNYRINMCYPTMEIKLPSLLFFNPKAKIKPRPGRADDPGTMIDERSKLLEDLAESFMTEEKVMFQPMTQLCLREAHYRFGIIRVGYNADYTDNPNVGKPVIDSETQQEMLKSDGTPVTEGAYTLQQESLYCKRIPASQFRVPVNAHNILEMNDWVAYFEWQQTDDIKNNPLFEHTDRVKSTARMRKEYSEFLANDPEADSKTKSKHRDMVKVWRCWDRRAMVYYTWIDGADFFLMQEPYKFLPFADLRFHQLLDEFYPLPPVFNWISPQDELNETRQMQRVHRKRFKRRFIRLRNFCSAEEWDKLESGDDGTCIEVSNLDGIRALEDAPLDSAIARNVPTSREDFRYVTGVSGEEHGVADAKTATQSVQLEANSRVRELAGKAVVGAWLGKVVKLMILTARDRMALPFIIERQVDPIGPGAMVETLRVATTWAAVTHDMIGDADFDVTVDLESMTPAIQSQERMEFMQMLSVVQQPANAILFSSSDYLLKRFLAGYGIRDDRTINEIRTAVQTTAIALAQMQLAGDEGDATSAATGQGKGGPGRKPPINRPPGPQGPPGAGGIMSQISGQMGLAGPAPRTH